MVALVDLDTYINDNVEVEFLREVLVGNPGGTIAIENNIDEGEMHNFALVIHNNGTIPIRVNKLRIGVNSDYGMISTGWNGTAWGMVAGGQWTSGTLDVLAPDQAIPPGGKLAVPHPQGGPTTFGYRADMWTGTAANEYQERQLLTAQILDWRPVVDSTRSKVFEFVDNIQRD